MKKWANRPATSANLPRSQATPVAGRSGRSASKLEEILNFSNLTQFRNSLLDVIPKLQENEYLRFVITKHGKPAAVIMSYEAYEFLKGAAGQIIEQEAAKAPDVALRDAYERMTQTKLDPPVQASEIASRLGVLAAEMKNLQTVISVADAFTQEAAKAETSDEQKMAKE